mgnify:CR=1 FL=1
MTILAEGALKTLCDKNEYITLGWQLYSCHIVQMAVYHVRLSAAHRRHTVDL